MSFRHPKSEVRSRARTVEDKEQVRQAFIAAGRKLFALNPASEVSLRKIAAEAGYAPAAIYQYFADQQELFFHVRAHEMQAATDQLRKSIARTRDPARRVQRLFEGAAAYWLDHMDEFLLTFPAPAARPAGPAPGGIPFGQSPEVQDALRLHYETVDAYFKTLPEPPISSRLATDILMAAVYGSIVFPNMARTMVWSDVMTMQRHLVATLLKGWAPAGRGVA
jgi:AcrR family transcriptional regulator